MFENPAADETEIVPLGDGRMIAFPYGGVWEEKILLGNMCSRNPYKPMYMKEVINQILEIHMRDGEETNGYRRCVKVEQGVEQVTFQSNDCTYKREYFVSEKLHALLLKVTATKAIQQSILTLNTNVHDKNTSIDNTNPYNSNSMKIAILDTDGILEDNTQARIIIQKATSFIIGVFDGDTVPIPERMDLYRYQELFELHCFQYQNVYKRVRFQLNGSDEEKRILCSQGGWDIHKPDDIDLFIFSYCKYLLLNLGYRKKNTKDECCSGIEDSKQFNVCLQYMNCMYLFNMAEGLVDCFDQLRNTHMNDIIDQATENGELDEIGRNLKVLIGYIDDLHLLYQVFYPFIRKLVFDQLDKQRIDPEILHLYKQLCNKLQLSSSLLENINEIANKEKFVQPSKTKSNDAYESLQQKVIDLVRLNAVWNPFYQYGGIPYYMLDRLIHLIIEEKEDELQLLPSLPVQWNEGKLTGIRIDRTQIIDVYWENHKVIDFRLTDWK